MHLSRKPEDGVHAVDAFQRAAAGAGLALVAGHGRVVEVGAAGALQHIAAHGGHVAQLGRSPGIQGLHQQRLSLQHQLILGHGPFRASAPMRRLPF